jgi:hypothetical protein
MRSNVRLKVGLSFSDVVAQRFGFPVKSIVVRFGQPAHGLIEFAYRRGILLGHAFVGSKKPALFVANHATISVHKCTFNRQYQSRPNALGGTKLPPTRCVREDAIKLHPLFAP